jgi:cytochrome c oxidase subunit 2
MTSWIRRRLHSGYPLITALLAVPSAAQAEWGLNLTEGVTPFSHTVYHLHMLILWICVAIGVVVFGLMGYSMLKFRKSQGAQPATWHENTKVEIIWTILPFAILVGLAIPATKALIMMEDVAESDMTIKVTGYQWMWHYQYVNEGISFFSKLDQESNQARQLGSGQDPAQVENYLLAVDKHLVVPVNKKIRFLTTAGDVIHAWWVPALGWKRDAVPGYINESWAKIEQPGIYRGQCAELCGRDHGFMPIVVEALSEADYAAWAEKTKSETQQAATEPVRTMTPALADAGADASLSR